MGTKRVRTRRKLVIAVATADWSRTFINPAGGMILGGAGWIRFGQLKAHSKHRVVIGKIIRSGTRLGVVDWDNHSTVTPDVLFIQRHMEKWMPDAVRGAVKSGQIVINDVDDWYWNLHPENQALLGVDPSLNRKANTQYYLESIHESSHLTVSTPFLFDQFTEQGLKPHLIENGVDCAAFASRRQTHSTPILGWTGSTAHRSGDLNIIKDFADKLPAYTWHHLGHHSLHPSFSEQTGIPESKLITTPMLPPWDYAQSFGFDIGVVPLTDHEFNSAKSWIKGIEYAAAGIPFIASPSPEYVRLNKEYGIGRIAHSPEEWVQHIQSMSDSKYREQEAERAYQVVSTQLDAHNQAQALDAFVESLVG